MAKRRRRSRGLAGGGSRKRKKARVEAAFRRYTLKHKGRANEDDFASVRQMIRIRDRRGVIPEYGEASRFITSVKLAKNLIEDGSCSSARKLINSVFDDLTRRFKTDAEKMTASRILRRVNEMYHRTCAINDDDS